MHDLSVYDDAFHFGSNDYNLVGMISHLGPQMGVANGIALSNELKKNKIYALLVIRYVTLHLIFKYKSNKIMSIK